jgi:hypothetical protein
MSVFETDNYKMAKSEEPQSTSQYTPFEESQFNYLNDINSGVYSSNPTLVQWDLTSIMSHNAFTSVEDLFVTIPIVMVAQYVTSAGLGIAPTGDATASAGVGGSTFTAGQSLGYSASLLALKGSYQSLVHQCELSVGGRVVSDLQPFTNIYSGFRLASQMGAGTDLRASAPSMGIADVGLDNQNSVVFSSKINPATADTIATSGCGLTNNRPFAGSVLGSVSGTQVQGVIGNQNKYVSNDAIGRRLSRIVDATTTGGVNGVYGTSGGQGSSTLTIMSSSQLQTELKPTVTLVNGNSTTTANSNYIVYQDTAILPLKYLMDVCNKLPMMKRTDMLLRMYLNTGSMLVPVKSGTTDAIATQYFAPQSSSFVNTCPFTVNYLGAGVPSTAVGIACGIFVARPTTTSLTSVQPTGAGGVTAVTTPVNLGNCPTTHSMTACRTYFNQISLTPEKEEAYLLANSAKPVVYERFIYNQYNAITAGSNYSQLIASGVKNPLACIIIPFISTANTGLSGSGTANFPAQYSSPFDTCGGISYSPISLTNLQVAVGMKNVLQNSLYFTFENYLEQVCQYESVSGNKLDILNSGIISQAWWEQNRVYFVNLSRGSPADRATPRNIQVSFTNNTNIIIDCQVYIIYADRITVNVRTGLVTQG